MKTKSPCVALSLAFTLCSGVWAPAALADSCIFAGNVNEVREYNGKKEVIRTGMEYVEGISDIFYCEQRLSELTDSALLEAWKKRLEEHRAKLPALREAWKTAILAHPEQVNDLFSASHDGPYTPLHLAVQANDLELVNLLLGMGAIPFLSTYEGEDAFLPSSIVSPHPGIHGVRYTPDPRVMARIKEARRGYNLHEICLRAQQAGHQLNEWHIRRAFYFKTQLEKLREFYANSPFRVLCGELRPCGEKADEFVLIVRYENERLSSPFSIRFKLEGGVEATAALRREIQTMEARYEQPLCAVWRYQQEDLTDEQEDQLVSTPVKRSDLLLVPQGVQLIQIFEQQHPELESKHRFSARADEDRH